MSALRSATRLAWLWLTTCPAATAESCVMTSSMETSPGSRWCGARGGRDRVRQHAGDWSVWPKASVADRPVHAVQCWRAMSARARRRPYQVLHMAAKRADAGSLPVVAVHDRRVMYGGCCTATRRRTLSLVCAAMDKRAEQIFDSVFRFVRDNGWWRRRQRAGAAGGRDQFDVFSPSRLDWRSWASAFAGSLNVAVGRDKRGRRGPVGRVFSENRASLADRHGCWTLPRLQAPASSPGTRRHGYGWLPRSARPGSAASRRSRNLAAGQTPHASTATANRSLRH